MEHKSHSKCSTLTCSYMYIVTMGESTSGTLIYGYYVPWIKAARIGTVTVTFNLANTVAVYRDKLISRELISRELI
jgi:hypothetical protein